jgi:hypothetical protein
MIHRMLPVLDALDRLHDRVRRSQLLYRVVLATSCLFAMAFVPTGLVKLMGDRFTTISTASPIGAFFEALYQTGGYWRFLGAAQLVAGILMLVPRAATLGAVLFFPVALNIFVITVALRFRGTTALTALMLFAATSLLAWDWDRLRGVVTARASSASPDRARWANALGPSWERAAYAIGTAAGLVVFSAVRGLAPMRLIVPALAVGGAAALAALAGAIVALRRSRG